MHNATGSWHHAPELPDHGGKLCLVQLQDRQNGSSYHAMRYVRNTWCFEGGARLSSEQRVVKWAQIADGTPGSGNEVTYPPEDATAPPVELPILTHKLTSALLGDQANGANISTTGKSIWIFADGPGDDRYIHAAFSTREAAEAARHLLSQDCTLEELPLDLPRPAAPEGHSLWYIEKLVDYEVLQVSAYLYNERTNVVRHNANSSNVLLWARDHVHALALAKELIEGEYVG